MHAPGRGFVFGADPVRSVISGAKYLALSFHSSAVENLYRPLVFLHCGVIYFLKIVIYAPGTLFAFY